MKVTIQSQFPFTDEACKAATGKTISEWNAVLEAFGGLPKGRRDLTQHLYTEYKMDLWWATTITVEYEALKGQKEKDGLLKGYFICSTKTITAPVEKVYKAW